MRSYLRDIRKEKDITMEQVARALGVTRQYYAMIENGQRKKNMDISTLYQISEYLQVPFIYLVELEMEWMEEKEKNFEKI